MELKLGVSASRTKRITSEAIEAFARASGDMNPVHLDEAYASTTTFGRRIAHGMLTASLVSAVLGNDLPGPGTVYLSQELKFKTPVNLNDQITATVELIRYRQEKRITTFRPNCKKQDGSLELEGEEGVDPLTKAQI